MAHEAREHYDTRLRIIRDSVSRIEGQSSTPDESLLLDSTYVADQAERIRQAAQEIIELTKRWPSNR